MSDSPDPRNQAAPAEGSPAPAAPERAERADDARASEPPGDDRIAALEAELESKAREAAENHDRFLRQAAELENFRRRSARERQESLRYASEGLVRDLLPILDNLERALEHASASPTPAAPASALVEGVRMTAKIFRDVLACHGVTPVAAAPGTPFDPNVHEAADVEETAALPPEVVVREDQPGYLLRERLVRPARVVVSRAPAQRPGAPEGAPAGEDVERGRS